MPKSPTSKGFHSNTNKARPQSNKSDNKSDNNSNSMYLKPQHQYGGKNLKALSNKRRFSIANSTSSSSSQDYLSDNESDKTKTTNQNSASAKHVHYMDSDSDSSLTAISDNEFTNSLQHAGKKKSRGKKAVSSKKGKSYGRKIIPRKSLGLSKHNLQDYENEVIDISSGDNSDDEVDVSDLISDVTRASDRPSEHGDGEEEEEDDEDDDHDDDSEDDENEHVAGLYALINNGKQLRAIDSDKSDEDSNDSDNGSDEEIPSSSDDDSDVDFVKLQKQQKANALQAARARKGLKKEQKQKENNKVASAPASAPAPVPAPAKSGSTTNEEQETSKNKSHRKNSIKYGRRKSDVILPDINFKFEFDNVADIEEEEEENKDQVIGGSNTDNFTKSHAVEEEDVGEEVDYSPTIPLDANQQHNFEFEFDQEFLHMPKMNDSDLNSDDDYEIDDNELLATLQAENDVDEFLLPQANDSIINEKDGSVASKNQPEVLPSTTTTTGADAGLESVTTGDNNEEEEEDDDDDDDENDPFLKEEEKFLVNEFENNGFDDNGDDKLNGDNVFDDDEDDDEEDDDDDCTFDDSEYSTSKRIVNAFKGIGEDRSKPIVQYESSASLESDYDEDDYVDFIDFDVPFFDENEIDGGRKSALTSPNKKLKTNGNRHSNSDEDDDSYLWNYFFSSDNDSSSEAEKDHLVQLDNGTRRSRRRGSKGRKLKSAHSNVDELFNEIDADKTFKTKNNPHHNTAKFKIKSAREIASRIDGSGAASTMSSYAGHYGDDENGYDDEAYGQDNAYDSSESTDVDETLPRNTNLSPQIGSKKATEVLSSKTADYRPPMLGSWVTIDSKPFGIIDGMSTRSLQQQHQQQQHQVPPTNKMQEPRGMVVDRRPFSPASHSGLAMAQSLGKRKSYGHIRQHNMQPLMSMQVQVQGQPNSDDQLVLGLDDLLNVSELDNDDENDVRIWRDFNNAQKSRVPLGAFRNKSILHNHHHRQQQQEEVHHNHNNYQGHRRNSNYQGQSHPHPGKHNINAGSQVSGPTKRRKSSLGPPAASAPTSVPVPVPATGGNGNAMTPVVASGGGGGGGGVGTASTPATVSTAAAPGYRSTRLGLFSEAALASVEEMLGDDYDVMTLIERL